MKSFKLFFPLLLYILFSTTGQSQGWIPQGEGVLPENYYTWALSAVDEQTVWALSYSAQDTDPKLIHTADGGETWGVKDISGFQGGDAYDIHAFSADSIWMLTLVPSGNTFIYLSADTANTWELKHSYQGAFVLKALKFGDKTSGYIIDPVTGAINTADGGASWSPIVTFSGPPGDSWGMANPTNWMDAKGDTVWWGTKKSIQRSTDNGETWEAIDNAFTNSFETKCISFSQSGTGLAISNTSPLGIQDLTHISRSLDGGTTWAELLNLNFPLEGLSDVPGTNEAFVGVGGIYKFFEPNLNLPYLSAYTLDAGDTWEVIDSFPLNAVEFVSPAVGWAGPLSYYDYEGNPALFKWDGFDLEAPVGTKDFTFISPTITPNPFSNQLQVSFSEVRKGIFLIRDISGRAIKQASFHSQLLEVNDLEYLPSGIYILELKGKDFIASKKVVKK